MVFCTWTQFPKERERGEKKKRKEPKSTFYFAHKHIPQKKQKREGKKTLEKDPNPP
jgi:hypothetical protein